MAALATAGNRSLTLELTAAMHKAEPVKVAGQVADQVVHLFPLTFASRAERG